MNITIELPWPSRILSPNARPHWASKAHCVKAARQIARLTTWYELNQLAEEDSPIRFESVRLHWTFCPPTRRTYDLDNLIAQMKSSQDGIADALRMDDSKFKSTHAMGDVIRGGKIIVSIGD